MPRSGYKRAAVLPAVYGFAFIAGLLLLLEGAVRAGLISKWILPSPAEIANAIWELQLSGALEAAVYQTMKAVSLCAIPVITVGVLTGYLLYRYPLAGRAYGPLLGSLFAVPLILFFPIFLVIFGRNYLALGACAFLHCVLPVIIYTREALLRVPPVFLKVGATFNVSDRDRFWKILFPHALPTIFVGIRLSVTYVLVYIVGIEFVISFGGLGLLISEMYQRFEIPKTFAAIFFVVLLSASLYFVLRGAEAWMRRAR